MLSESQAALTMRHIELAQRHKGAGALVTKLLYEETDGIWLKFQGESREKYGTAKEMKVGMHTMGCNDSKPNPVSAECWITRLHMPALKMSESFARTKRVLWQAGLMWTK